MLETGKFVFKSKNLILPVEIGNYFSIDRCSEEHNHRTRYQTSGSNSDAPRIICRTKIAEKSVQFVGTKLWSGLQIKLCFIVINQIALKLVLKLSA